MVHLISVAHTRLILVVFRGVQRQLLVKIHLDRLHLALLTAGAPLPSCQFQGQRLFRAPQVSLCARLSYLLVRGYF